MENLTTLRLTSADPCALGSSIVNRRDFFFRFDDSDAVVLVCHILRDMYRLTSEEKQEVEAIAINRAARYHDLTIDTIDWCGSPLVEVTPAFKGVKN